MVFSLCRVVVEIQAPPAEGAFTIRVHSPREWVEPTPKLPWLPLTMIYNLPHLHASFQITPDSEVQSGLLLVDTGEPPCLAHPKRGTSACTVTSPSCPHNAARSLDVEFN